MELSSASQIGGPEIEAQITELLTGERIGLFEMIEARQMVERGCAEYVIKNLRKGDLKRIKNCVIHMQEAIEKSDWDGYRSANQRFHSCMIGVTRNRIIEEIYRSFLDPSRSELWKRMNMCGSTTLHGRSSCNPFGSIRISSLHSRIRTERCFSKG